MAMPATCPPCAWALALVASASIVVQTTTAAAGSTRTNRVVWTDLLPEPGIDTTQGNATTYHNSMPIGNGVVAANVNYDAHNDTLAVLISAATAWAEDGILIKVALLEVSLPPRGGAALGSSFSQTFNPADATVRIAIPAGRDPAAAPATTVVAYVDAHNDSVVVSVSPPSDQVVARLVALHTGRPSGEATETCAKIARSADVVASAGNLVYHHNLQHWPDTYMARSFKILNIPLDIPGFVDPLANRSTGVMLARAHTEAAAGTAAATTFAATVLTTVGATAAEFETAVAGASAAFGDVLRRTEQLPSAAHAAWWAAKWSSHTIEITAAGEAAADAATVTRMYALQRFIELSQARSPFPIKFNGMLYTAHRDPMQVDQNLWGGLNWWQNIRHPYYNMLTSGDTDEMRTLFDSFARTVPVARARTMAYFGFEGIWWPEYTLPHHGTPHLGGVVPLYVIAGAI